MSLSALSKDQLVFDSSDPTEGDQIGGWVLAGDDGTPITHTTIGLKEALDVNIVNGPDDAIYKEDSVHADEDLGNQVLSVRKNALSANTDADGDYASLLTNNDGALWTVPVGDVGDDEAEPAGNNANPVKVGFTVDDVLTASTDGFRVQAVSDLYRRQWVNNGADIAMTHAAVSVDDTIGGTQLKASALACRRNLLIQNLDNKAIYIGLTGVTAANGIRVGAKQSMMLDIGPHIDVYALGDAGAADVRVMELG